MTFKKLFIPHNGTGKSFVVRIHTEEPEEDVPQMSDQRHILRLAQQKSLEQRQKALMYRRALQEK